MRYWSTSDGLLLVEKMEGLFLRLTSDGKVDRVFADRQTSDQEYLYTMTHAVEGDRLVCATEIENSDTCRTSTSKEVMISGLAEARAEDWPRAVEAARKC